MQAISPHFFFIYFEEKVKEQCDPETKIILCRTKSLSKI